MNHEIYMRRALELAEKGCGHVNPNPMVGAVIVKDGRIIGEGYHARFGELHAERAALASCRESAQGGWLYVTLEPCCHQGKQPPCTEAILQSGISRVIVGSADPNPLVAGKGVAFLRSQGVQVTEGVLREDCDRLNRIFFHYVTTKRPYVIMKYAMTADGKIASATGASKWITGPQARRRVQEERNRCAAIMVGLETVIKDDPMLNCRLPGRVPEAKDPVRVVCDTRLRTPLEARVVTTAGRQPTIIATCCGDPARHEPYQKAGCRLLHLPYREGHTDLKRLLFLLGEMKLDSVLLEGGGRLNWSALRSGVVNRVQAYIAPKILGGGEAPSPVDGLGVDEPDQAFRLSPPEITRLGEDILLESEVLKCLPES